MIERRTCRPCLVHHVQIIVGARIAFGLGQEIAIALLFCVRAAADDMHHQSPVEARAHKHNPFDLTKVWPK